MTSDGPMARSEHTDFLAPAQAPDEIGRLGPYRVLQVLGHGGMGVVYKAEDTQLQRPVALKAILPSLASSASARQRFLREARAAAALKHDHIVAIYQVGEDRGAPFLAMEFLEGEPLDARLKREPPLSLREMVRIGRETALGLAAAHARGLIHRDIKPANLWLDGSAGGRVKILDFGLARGGAEEPQLTQLTQQGAIVGTPAYMAPEQAEGSKVDARTDLFSLGCVLYRLTTGELPFKGSDSISTLLAVVGKTPSPPRQVNSATPAALSDLVMRLLAKKPDDRPASAQVVADALAAIENGHADVLPACAPTEMLPVLRRQAKSWPRWPAVAAVGVVLALGAATAVVALIGKGSSSPDTPDSRTKDDGKVVGAKPVKVDPPPPISPFALVQYPPAIPGVESWSIEPRAHRGPVSVVACGKDGKRLASGGDDGTVRLWTLKDGRLLSLFLGHRARITCLAWSPDGTILASGSMDRSVRLWEADTGKLLHQLQQHDLPIRALAWSPDGKSLASGSADRSVRLWDVASGTVRRAFNSHTAPVGEIIWPAQGTIVSISGQENGPRTAWVWDPGTGTTRHSEQWQGRIAWTAERKVGVYKTADDTLAFWDVNETTPRNLTLKDHAGPILCFDVSPDGGTVATVGRNMVHWWDAATGKLLTVSQNQNYDPTAVAFSADGRTLASIHYGWSVVLWKTGSATPYKSVAVHPGSGLGWATSAESTTGFSGNDHTMTFWDAASGKVLHTLPVCWGGDDVAWAPDGKRLAVCTNRHHLTLRIWEADTGAPVRALAHDPGYGQFVDWSPDGTTLAAYSIGYSVVLWDASTGKPGKRLTGHANHLLTARYSPDGKKIATCGHYQQDTVRIIDVASGKGFNLSDHLAFGGIPYHALGWSPDSRYLTAGAGEMKIWDAATGTALPVKLEGQKAKIHAAAWSRDGRTLAGGDATGTIRLWDPTTGELLKTDLGHEGGPVHTLAWLPDDKTLVSFGERDGTVRFWQTDTDRPPRVVKGFPRGWGRFSPDGRYLLSRFAQGRVHLWETDTGRLLGSLFHIPGEPDQYLTVAGDGHYRISSQAHRHVVYVV